MSRSRVAPRLLPALRPALIPALILAASAALAASPPDPAGAIARVLDDWHDAAAKADEARYFAHFAPEGVFLGTDPDERWTVPEFRAFAHPYFSKGKAWSFRAHDRHVVLSPDGTLAWFDERLDTPNMGPCRGSGVLRKVDGAWRIALYDLSIPIPNPLTKELVGRIAGWKASSRSGGGPGER